MRKILLASSILVLIFLSGCVGSVGNPPPKGTNFGTAPLEFKKQIQYYHSSRLKDPYSAKYEFNGTPYKGYINDYPNTNKLFWKGWVVCYTINAKNSYGGYIGVTEYCALFNNGRVYGSGKALAMPRLMRY